MTLAIALAWIAIFAGLWLGWQIFRQNGRILLRLDELEKRFNELGFDGTQELEGLPLGSEAPAFELPDLADKHHTLAQYRGQTLLLVFFNPDCGFCRQMLPKVVAGFQPIVEGGILPPGNHAGLAESPESSEDSAPTEASSAGLEARLTDGQGCLPPRLLILTTGGAEKNRQFFAEHKVDCTVLMQNDGEIAKAFQAKGTPTGYLVGADGKIASELAIGAEALLKLAVGRSEIRNPKSEDQNRLTSAPTNEVDGSRFGKRSLARSRIKRDGLKAGTPAPDFSLPRLDGRGDLTLSGLQGKHVLLVFSSPHCGPCNTLAPELEKFHRENEGRARHSVRAESSSAESGAQRTDAPYPITVVMVSKGEPKENRKKVKEHGLTFPVVLQQQWEISRRYAMFATPVAYLIDEAGVISHDVAVGVEPILALLTVAGRQVPERAGSTPGSGNASLSAAERSLQAAATHA